MCTIHCPVVLRFVAEMWLILFVYVCLCLHPPWASFMLRPGHPCGPTKSKSIILNLDNEEAFILIGWVLLMLMPWHTCKWPRKKQEASISFLFLDAKRQHVSTHSNFLRQWHCWCQILVGVNPYRLCCMLWVFADQTVLCVYFPSFGTISYGPSGMV